MSKGADDERTVEEVSRDVELDGSDLALRRVEGHAGQLRHARRVGHVNLQMGRVSFVWMLMPPFSSGQSQSFKDHFWESSICDWPLLLFARGCPDIFLRKHKTLFVATPATLGD